jgi:hypothetical protein
VAEGALEFGAPVANDRGGWRIPILLRVNVELNLQGLTFSAGYDIVPAGASLDFVAAGQQPGVTDRGVPGKIAVAWLDGWHAEAGQIVGLGYIETSMPAETLRIYGVSANAVGSGRPVAISLPQQNRKTR